MSGFHQFSLRAICLLAVISLSGCDSNEWVEFESTGCNEQELQGDSIGGAFFGQMAESVCKGKGLEGYAGELQCDGEAIMIACKG